MELIMENKGCGQIRFAVDYALEASLPSETSDAMHGNTDAFRAGIFEGSFA